MFSFNFNPVLKQIGDRRTYKYVPGRAIIRYVNSNGSRGEYDDFSPVSMNARIKDIEESGGAIIDFEVEFNQISNEYGYTAYGAAYYMLKHFLDIGIIPKSSWEFLENIFPDYIKENDYETQNCL